MATGRNKGFRIFTTCMCVLFLIAAPGISSAEEIDEANKLDERMMALYQRGQYAEAAQMGERLLAIREKVLGPEHPDTATSLNNLALLYDNMGDYAKAEPLFKRALAISEKVLGPEHSDTATSLNNLAALYKRMSDYAKAEPLYKRSLAIKEKVLGQEHPDTATTLNNLASLYQAMGDYAKAEPLYKRALAIKEKVLGSEHPSTATSLNNLALLYDNMGDYAKAEPLYKRSLAIHEKAFGSEYPSTATSLNNLAGLYVHMGDYAKAEPLLKRSLAIDEKALGTNHPGIATPLNNLALLYDNMGDYAKAEPLYKRSLAIHEKAFGPVHPDTATSLNNLAALYVHMGDHAKAEPLYKRSLEIREKVLGPEHSDTATSLNNLAELYSAMGDYAKAEPLHKRSLAIKEKVLGPEHPSTATSLNGLAALYGAQGKNRESLALFKRGLVAEDRVIQNVFSIASEKQKLQFIEQHSANYIACLSLIHRRFITDQEALRTGLNLVLSRKGVVFDAQARQSDAVAQSLDPKTKDAWILLNSKRAELGKLLQNKPEKLSSDDYRARIASLQQEVEELERELSATSGIVKEELDQRKATYDKVADRLSPDSVLMEFVRIWDFDWEKGKWGFGARYIVFILHPNNQIELVDLGDADAMDKEINKHLAVLGKTSSTINKMAKAQGESAGKLHDLVWKPLASAVGSASSVIVSPDGVMNLVPFSAFKDESGKFLVESKTLTYVTSGRDLLRSGGLVKPETDFLIVANPAFDTVAKASVSTETGGTVRTRSRNFSMKFDPLPGTAKEAEVIPGLLTKQTGKVITETSATEPAVLSALRSRVLHFATHGFFMPDQVSLTSGNERGMMGEEAKIPPGYENPLTRSGLALAGANHANETESGDDGLLTALEVSGMNLRGTDLVALSACDTGVGEVKTGEGVFGLRRAFALAGTRNLMMSLWPVSDDITVEQMSAFYRMYGEGKTPTVALRAAQLDTIAKLKARFGSAPPSLWAPFIMQGAPGGN